MKHLKPLFESTPIGSLEKMDLSNWTKEKEILFCNKMASFLIQQCVGKKITAPVYGVSKDKLHLTFNEYEINVTECYNGKIKAAFWIDEKHEEQIAKRGFTSCRIEIDYMPHDNNKINEMVFEYERDYYKNRCDGPARIKYNGEKNKWGFSFFMLDRKIDPKLIQNETPVVTFLKSTAASIRKSIPIAWVTLDHKKNCLNVTINRRIPLDDFIEVTQKLTAVTLNKFDAYMNGTSIELQPKPGIDLAMHTKLHDFGFNDIE